MTIIAGFKTHEGVVICADTQETIGHISKRNVPKLRFEPADSPFFGRHGHHGGDVAAAFCGAANNGPFIDKLVDDAWVAAQGCTSIDEACREIETSLKDTYKEFGTIYQPGYCPEADLIYAVKMSGRTKLFSALGPLVTEQTEYASGGAGYYMVDFLKGRMFRRGLNLHQCVILAAYILFQAKEHADGCGGESHIAILRDNGVSGRVATDRITAITSLLELADNAAGRVLLDAADLEKDDAAFRSDLESIVEVMSRIRNAKRKEVAQARETWDAISKILGGGSEPPVLDEFGLPKRLDAQTSTGPQ